MCRLTSRELPYEPHNSGDHVVTSEQLDIVVVRPRKDEEFLCRRRGIVHPTTLVDGNDAILVARDDEHRAVDPSDVVDH